MVEARNTVTEGSYGQKVILGTSVTDIDLAMQHFGLLDYVVFGLLLLVCVAIGIFFAWRAKGSSQDYLVGGRNMQTMPIALSLIASKMSGYRPEYTIEEDLTIINYIISNEAYSSVRGKKFWENMVKDTKNRRTWQSLKEHFLKKISTNIHKYKIDKTDKEKFINLIKLTTPKQVNQETEEVNNIDFVREIVEDDDFRVLQQTEPEPNASVTTPRKKSRTQYSRSFNRDHPQYCKKCREQMKLEDYLVDEDD